MHILCIQLHRKIVENRNVRVMSRKASTHEHFQRIIATFPPKNMYSRFFTSCVISNPKPSPTTTCHDAPNFLSIVSFIIFAAVYSNEKQKTSVHYM